MFETWNFTVCWVIQRLSRDVAVLCAGGRRDGESRARARSGPSGRRRFREGGGDIARRLDRRVDEWPLAASLIEGRERRGVQRLGQRAACPGDECASDPCAAHVDRQHEHLDGLLETLAANGSALGQPPRDRPHRRARRLGPSLPDPSVPLLRAGQRSPQARERRFPGHRNGSPRRSEGCRRRSRLASALVLRSSGQGRNEQLASWCLSNRRPWARVSLDSPYPTNAGDGAGLLSGWRIRRSR